MSGSWDTYILRKIKEDCVRGQELIINKELNFLYN